MSKIPNINNLMSMAQNMAKQMEEKLNALEVEGNAGGGMVVVKLNGHKNLLEVKISPEVVDASDVGMLQDLILAAVHDASAKIDDKLKEEYGQLGGGLPGGFPFGAI